MPPPRLDSHERVLVKRVSFLEFLVFCSSLLFLLPRFPVFYHSRRKKISFSHSIDNLYIISLKKLEGGYAPLGKGKYDRFAPLTQRSSRLSTSLHLRYR